VKLDPSCNSGSNTAPQYIATGGLGTYVFKKITTAVSVDQTYTFNNFQCTKNTVLNFNLFHMSDSTGTNGEQRTSSYTLTANDQLTAATNDATGTLGTISAISLSSNQASLAGVQMKIKFNLGNFRTYLTSSSYLVITFYDTASSVSNFINTITDCKVYGGLTPYLANKGVTCSPTSAGAGSVVISNIQGASATDDITMLITGTTLASSTGSCNLAFTLYDDSSRYTASDFSKYSKTSTFTSSITLYTVGSSDTFTVSTFSVTNEGTGVVPYPDDMNTQTILMTINPNTLSTTYYSTNGDTLKIYFDTWNSVFTGTPACTVTSTVSYPWAGTCSVNVASQYIQVDLYDDDADDTTGPLTSLPQITLRITDTLWKASSTPYFYRLELNANTPGAFETSGFISTTKPQGTNPTQVFSAVPLHRSLGAYTEYTFAITTNKIALDSTRMLSIKYSNLDNRQSSYSQIDCQCSVSAKCYHYDSSETSFDIIFGATVAAGTAVTCYIPDIKNPASATSESLDMRIMDVYNREIYLQTTESVSTYVALTSNSHTLAITGAPSTVTAGTPSPGSYPVTYTAGSQVYSAGSYLYVDFQKSGVNSPSSCPYSPCRIYNTVRNIMVIEIPASTTSTFDLYTATSITADYSSAQSSDNKPLSYISDNTKAGVVTIGTSSSPTVQASQSSNTIVAVDQKLNKLQALLHISFTTGSVALPSTGVIRVELTGPTIIGTICYASVSYVTVTCSISS